MTLSHKIGSQNYLLSLPISHECILTHTLTHTHTHTPTPIHTHTLSLFSSCNTSMLAFYTFYHPVFYLLEIYFPHKPIDKLKP